MRPLLIAKFLEDYFLLRHREGRVEKLLINVIQYEDKNKNNFSADCSN